MSLKNYIVRIYRYEKDKPRELVGMVEEVGVSGKKAFTDLEELWEILNSTKQQKDNELSGITDNQGGCSAAE